MSVIAFCVPLNACTYLPSHGPLSTEISSQSNSTKNYDFPFSLIDINHDTIAAIVANEPDTFKSIFGGKQWRPKSEIGVGDVLSVVVWEPSGQGGLFAGPETAGKAELGPFQVPQNGKIPVPYIGQITVKGRTIAQVRWAIQDQLQDKAILPQVVVSITENASSVVSVNGDARKPGQYPISLRGDKLADIVAKAGGSSTPATETRITLVRGQKTATQQLSSLLSSPRENIYVRPDDQVYLTHNPATFTAFGAISKSGEYPLKEGEVSLIEALGRIGGLDDDKANAAGLFIFRYEEPSVLNDLELEDQTTQYNKTPVIYKLNMKDGKSYFYGQAFNIRDKDVIYVANAGGNELRKFLNILSGITATSIGIAAIAN